MESPITLSEKLFQLQGMIQPIAKDSTNPFYDSRYFDINKLLEILKPLLQELDLYILQPGVMRDGHNGICTQIIDKNTKEMIESFFAFPNGLDAQKLGAASTYLRRHSLSALLSLESMDDDGNSAVIPPAKKPITYNHNHSEPLPPEPVVHSDEEPKSIYTQKCPKCGKTMLLRPAGISKTTGKSYKAFYSCTQECKTTVPLNTY